MFGVLAFSIVLGASLPVVHASPPLNVPTLTTSLSATPITAGSSVYDTATFTNFVGRGLSTGDVFYFYFSGGTCSGSATFAGPSTQPANVFDGIALNSDNVTLSTPGIYSWDASFTGDANNAAVTSQCEPLTVQSVPTLTTNLSATTITAGGSVTDFSDISNCAVAPFPSGNCGEGNLVYWYYSGGSCSGTGTFASTGGVSHVLPSGLTPNSDTVTFNTPGTYSFRAEYDGNSYNAPVTSQCEPLNVLSSVGVPEFGASPLIVSALGLIAVGLMVKLRTKVRYSPTA